MLDEKHPYEQSQTSHLRGTQFVRLIVKLASECMNQKFYMCRPWHSPNHVAIQWVPSTQCQSSGHGSYLKYSFLSSLSASRFAAASLLFFSMILILRSCCCRTRSSSSAPSTATEQLILEASAASSSLWACFVDSLSISCLALEL